MTRYLSKSQIRDLLFMLDGERYDDIDKYRELKRILFNSLPNYYGKRKYSSIKSYINKEIIPQRIQNIANDLEIFNSYVPPQHLTRLNPAALNIKDRIMFSTLMKEEILILISKTPTTKHKKHICWD